MNVAVTGATGLVGTALCKELRAAGETVIPLVRRQAEAGEIRWDPAAEQIDAAGLESVDAIVHLAGDNVAEGRWNVDKKRRIRESRVKGTQLIANTLAGLSNKPRVFVCASAIGYYGDQRIEPVDESSLAGMGFLAEVCEVWESSCQAAVDAGIRTVNARIGVILSTDGGALAKMLTPFKMCAGGIVGSGQQIWSWVSIHDVVGAILHAIRNEAVSGPMNVTSPNPCTNAEFTKSLGHVLGRPTVLPMPAFAARLAFGEMADGLLLASSHVTPQKLIETGFSFRHEDLEPTLRALLN